MIKDVWLFLEIQNYNRLDDPERIQEITLNLYKWENRDMSKKIEDESKVTLIKNIQVFLWLINNFD